MTVNDSAQGTNPSKKSEAEEVKVTEVVETTEEPIDEPQAQEVPSDVTATQEFKDAVSQATEKQIQARIAREVEKSRRLAEELLGVKDALSKKEDELATVLADAGVLRSENVQWRVATQEGVSLDVVASLKGETFDELVESVRKVRVGSSQPKTIDRIFEGKPSGDHGDIADEIIKKYYS